MELYILRHGMAEEQSSTGRDQDRQLTPEGRSKLKGLLKLTKAAGVQPSLILSSPYVRAMQTARLAAAELGYSADIVATAALTPDARPEDVRAELQVHSEHDSVLLASHNPLCAELAAHLLKSPNLHVDFKKGAMMCVEISPSRNAQGVLRWMLIPKIAAS